MNSYLKLLRMLADGEFYSGEKMARELGVTRAAVWKQLKKIEQLGIGIDAVRGKGYRLQQPLQLLDNKRICSQLSDTVRHAVERLEVLAEVDSTNRYLMELQGPQQGVLVCLTETQSQGKGRRGRQWVSPFARNLYLSVKWRYNSGPMALAGLSLALGVATMRVLDRVGCDNIGLKWPNDIYWQDKKMGGILVEFSGDASGPCEVVAGLGLNLSMPEGVDASIDQPWAELAQVLGPRMPDRNTLAAQLLEQLVEVMSDYADKGFQTYRAEWDSWDIARGKRVCLSRPGHEQQGVMRGVDNEGSLLLDGGQGIEIIHSGELSLRIQP